MATVLPIKSLFPALATPPEIDFLCRTIRLLPFGAIIVEIGVWEGGTTVPAAHAAREVGAGVYYAVDHWKGSPDLRNSAGPEFRKARFLQNLRAAGLDDFVKTVQMTSIEAVPLFSDGTVDLAYIDANHEYDAVKADIAAWWPKVRPGGFLAGHDFDPEHPGVVRAVNEFLAQTNLPLSTSEGRWPVWRVRKP